MEAGITVITHEAASQQNVHYDIEAFVNEDFGANLMEQLATCMGGEGEYAVFVGSLTSQTHNQWVDGAIAYQQANYPNMTMVGDKNETFDDAQNAYERAQEVLRAFPNVKGCRARPRPTWRASGLPSRSAGSRTRPASSAPRCRRSRASISRPAPWTASASGIRPSRATR
jgi:simple sugar transport system substrate-binding protein